MEFIKIPEIGRSYRHHHRVLLSDADPDGRLRIDGVSRILHDAATLDNQSAPLDDKGLWVIRSIDTRIHFYPRYLEEVEAVTACTGTGRAWAERRTDLLVGGKVAIAARATWINTSPATGLPAQLPAGFDEVFGPSAQGRVIRPALRMKAPSEDPAQNLSFPVRYGDQDVVGHVNNAVYAAALEEAARASALPGLERAEGYSIEFVTPAQYPGSLEISLWQGGRSLTAAMYQAGTLASIAKVSF